MIFELNCNPLAPLYERPPVLVWCDPGDQFALATFMRGAGRLVEGAVQVFSSRRFRASIISAR